MRRRFIAVSTAVLACTMSLAPAASADLKQTKVVSTNPANTTPHVLDGTVRAIAVVGTKVVVGGNFEKVREAGTGKPTIARHNIFAFDSKTGKVDTTFKPKVDGTVYALETGPSNTVYAGGAFANVNGVALGALTQLSVPAGTAVAKFKARVGGGLVFTMVRRNTRIYIGGKFTKVAGQARTGLARIDGTSGAPDANFNLSVSMPRAGELKVFELAVNPQDTRLVINGTFTMVAGTRRYQIAMIDTTKTPAALTSWSTERYASPCNINSFDTYMRGMDFAPDGSYFVVVTTGGPFGTTQLCDSAARWETNKTGAGQQPTWVNYTGGDTLLSVSVTGAAVYVAGHQRWQDNPQGKDKAGPGAVSREGIAALNPVGGKALAWNPTRSRGHGVEALVATSTGLWVGSDTDQLGKEYHGRVGFFPLS
ncbi:delta-60 repeat domain-containing protein [Actinomadura sp. HBU206391]|uniref:delta-60 repeat domain-containing protein n=1 Tax=Actinomadura sp. HBU206391 TaxID=2731692 RepID=UPI00164EF0D3|nr:delta-60 repeat domain-containing protein [Actinomadura sp. HBU206391]MBC6459062.1 delta-60 repeat domain-containing protein [Actinomadura sp. HBU206391]